MIGSLRPSLDSSIHSHERTSRCSFTAHGPCGYLGVLRAVMPILTKRGAHGGRSSSAGGQFVCITYLCIGRALWAWNQEGQCKIALIRTQLVNFMQEHVNNGQFFFCHSLHPTKVLQSCSPSLRSTAAHFWMHSPSTVTRTSNLLAPTSNTLGRIEPRPPIYSYDYRQRTAAPSSRLFPQWDGAHRALSGLLTHIVLMHRPAAAAVRHTL